MREALLTSFHSKCLVISRDKRMVFQGWVLSMKIQIGSKPQGGRKNLKHHLSSEKDKQRGIWRVLAAAICLEIIIHMRMKMALLKLMKLIKKMYLVLLEVEENNLKCLQYSIKGSLKINCNSSIKRTIKLIIQLMLAHKK